MFKIDSDSFLLESCNVYWGREEKWQIAELPNFIMELELCRYSDYRSVRVINGIYWDSIANQLKKCGYKLINYCNGDTGIERPYHRNIEIDNATKEYICIWYNEKPDWRKERLLKIYPSFSLIVNLHKGNKQMKKCVNTREFVETNPNPIPDGKYPGVWSSFEVKFSVGERSFVTETETGVKGKVPCVVHVVNNQIWVN